MVADIALLRYLLLGCASLVVLSAARGSRWTLGMESGSRSAGDRFLGVSVGAPLRSARGGDRDAASGRDRGGGERCRGFLRRGLVSRLPRMAMAGRSRAAGRRRRRPPHAPLARGAPRHSRCDSAALETRPGGSRRRSVARLCDRRAGGGARHWFCAPDLVAAWCGLRIRRGSVAGPRRGGRRAPARRDEARVDGAAIGRLCGRGSTGVEPSATPRRASGGDARSNALERYRAVGSLASPR